MYTWISEIGYLKKNKKHCKQLRKNRYLKKISIFGDLLRIEQESSGTDDAPTKDTVCNMHCFYNSATGLPLSLSTI